MSKRDWWKKSESTGKFLPEDGGRTACLGEIGKELRERARILRERSDKLSQEEREIAEQRRSMREDKEPLSPSKWIENEYFCGHFARDMFDVLKEEFCDIYERNYFEVLMLGSVGYGKTTLCQACHLYSKYLLTCYGVPQRAFRGMVESAQILFMNLNVTREKAKNGYFVGFNELIKSVPYFQNEFKLAPNLVNEIRIPTKRILAKYSGATKTAAESENLIFCVMDEANLYDVVERSKRSVLADEKYDAAEVVHTSALRRMQTRFMLPDGKMPLPSKLISLCKETYPDSFMRRRARESIRNGDDVRGRTKIIQYAEWETRPPGTHEKKYFWIKTGTRTESPRIIEKRKDAQTEIERSKELEKTSAAEDSRFEVIRVPLAGGEYLMSARRNLPDFIRDVCGRATESLRMYLPEREVLFKAYRDPKEHPLHVCDHPFSSESTTFYDGAFLIKERLSREVRGRWRPIVNPSAPRFFCIDAGVTGDACGMAMSHVAGFKRVLQMGMEGEASAVYRMLPIHWFDLLLHAPPPIGGEIPFGAILGLIESLGEIGFNIEMVGLDMHQRVALTQPLEQMGIGWERIPLEEDTVAYDMLRDAYSDGRVSAYPHGVFEREMGALERINTGRIKSGQPVEKMDHPPHGSKDVSDAAARCAFLVEREAATRSDARATIATTKTEKKTKAEEEREMYELYETGNWEEMQEKMGGEEEW